MKGQKWGPGKHLSSFTWFCISQSLWDFSVPLYETGEGDKIVGVIKLYQVTDVFEKPLWGELF